MSEPLTIAVLGCGSRGRTYSRILSTLPSRYRLTAAVDPVEARREAVGGLSDDGSILRFESDEAFFAAGKLADVLIIATQDSQHFGHAMAALEVMREHIRKTLARKHGLDVPAPVDPEAEE